MDTGATDRPKVYVTREIPNEGIQMLRQQAQVDVWPEKLPPEKSVIMENIADADALLCLLTDTIDAEVMEAGPELKVISNYAVVYNNIDVEAATERGIPVGNTPGVLTDTTCDLAWTLLMAIGRRIVEAAGYVRDGNWETWGSQLMMGRDIHGATLGIIGLGRIGSTMAKRAQGFDMELVYYDVERREDVEADLGLEFAAFEDVLGRADFLTLHTPLVDATYHLIGERELQLMQDNALLINTSRGEVIDEEALIAALRDGEIRGAALDVTEGEPIDPDSPLLDMPNVIVTPHIGSASEGTRGKMARMAAENAIAGISGEPLPNCVNPQVQQ